MERIRPSLQCSSVVHPHAVMALKLSVEKEANTTVVMRSLMQAVKS